jgi:hypothetical protein
MSYSAPVASAVPRCQRAFLGSVHTLMFVCPSARQPASRSVCHVHPRQTARAVSFQRDDHPSANSVRLSLRPSVHLSVCPSIMRTQVLLRRPGRQLVEAPVEVVHATLLAFQCLGVALERSLRGRDRGRALRQRLVEARELLFQARAAGLPGTDRQIL